MTESKTQATMGYCIPPDWRGAIDSVFAILLAVGVEAMKVWARSNSTYRSESREDDRVSTNEPDERAATAAALLGVDLTASADEVRRALRARVFEARIHPDHGGNEETAKQLIAAKNLLVELAARG
jgi:hypothetical protein